MQPSSLSTAQYGDVGPYSKQAIPCYCPTAKYSPTKSIPVDSTGTQVPCGDAMDQGRPTATGTLIFRPQEIKLQDASQQLEAYCQIKLGFHRERTSIINLGAETRWNEEIALRFKGQESAEIKIKDKSIFKLRNHIGEGKIELAQTISQGRSNQWVPLYKKGQQIGEIHILIEFVPETM